MIQETLPFEQVSPVNEICCVVVPGMTDELPDGVNVAVVLFERRT